LCLWLNRAFVWKEELKPELHFKLELFKLRASICQEAERDWSMVSKYFEKGNFDRGKKTIVHLLRVLLLSTQIATEGRITNFYASYKYSQDMNQFFNKKDWKTIIQKYEPIYKRLREQFQQATQKK
jgi:hypothetical protein